MSDPEQPGAPDWWSTTRPGPPPTDDDTFAPLDGASPPPPTQPVAPSPHPPYPPTGHPPPTGYPPPPTGYPPPPPPPPYGYPPQYQPPTYAPYVPYGYGAPPAAKTNGMAVGSLICGIVSIPGGLLCLVPAVAAIPGLVLGIAGLRRINGSGGTEQGRGVAIAGIATSAVGIVVLVLLAILFGFALSSPTSEF
ncbi:MAG: DUF4190 domain-containing protein [Acidimicrobiales bacterium]